MHTHTHKHTHKHKHEHKHALSPEIILTHRLYIPFHSVQLRWVMPYQEFMQQLLDTIFQSDGGEQVSLFCATLRLCDVPMAQGDSEFYTSTVMKCFSSNSDSIAFSLCHFLLVKSDLIQGLITKTLFLLSFLLLLSPPFSSSQIF